MPLKKDCQKYFHCENVDLGYGVISNDIRINFANSGKKFVKIRKSLVVQLIGLLKLRRRKLHYQKCQWTNNLIQQL